MTSKLSNEYLLQSSLLLDQAMLKIEHCEMQLTDSQICSRPNPGINSIGNLILHMAGNLRQWAIVPNVADESDERDRQQEFADCEMSKDDLMKQLRATVDLAKQTFQSLQSLEPESLLESQTIQGFTLSRLGAITHTTTHFVGHTHQVIMLTRLILGDDYVFHWTAEEGDRSQVPV